MIIDDTIITPVDHADTINSMLIVARMYVSLRFLEAKDWKKKIDYSVCCLIVRNKIDIPYVLIFSLIVDFLMYIPVIVKAKTVTL